LHSTPQALPSFTMKTTTQELKPFPAHARDTLAKAIKTLNYYASDPNEIEAIKEEIKDLICLLNGWGLIARDALPKLEHYRVGCPFIDELCLIFEDDELYN
jgi:hypothetical protein